MAPCRAFGGAVDDLAVDFDQPDRAALTTSVLALCCADDSHSLGAREDLAWSLPLGARIARLLRILKLTTHAESLPLAPVCPHPECRQRFEVSLPFEALLANAEENGAAGKVVRFPLAPDTPVTLRLPTGRDQATWRRRNYGDRAEALAAIVRSLVVEPAGEPVLEPAQLAPLAAAMEAADPLVAFTIRTRCPHCERESELPVDLEAAALRELAQHRRTVLREVHEFARHYGWTEAEVLAVPPARRAEYRKLIAAGEGHAR